MPFTTGEPPINSADVPCECGQWTHHLLHLVSEPGFSATPTWCPKCRRTHLHVFRINAAGSRVLVSSIAFNGRNERTLRRALLSVPGITAADVDFMLTSARTVPAGGG